VRRPTRTTDAPASASASAIARPIPELAPVTTAVRWSSEKRSLPGNSYGASGGLGRRQGHGDWAIRELQDAASARQARDRFEPAGQGVSRDDGRRIASGHVESGQLIDDQGAGKRDGAADGQRPDAEVVPPAPTTKLAPDACE